MEKQAVLQIRGLHKYFPVSRSLLGALTRRPRRYVRAVDGVSLSLQRGEILALVGESGSGKTTVGMNVLGLQQPTQGRVLFDGYDVAHWACGRNAPPETGWPDSLAGQGRRRRVLTLRERTQMIFQDPYEALNPRQKVFDIVAEPLDIHGLARSREEKTQRVREAMEACGLSPADHFWDRYPAELSGGQRQRVVIAGALILNPELLVADEPVSMLDVSIRAEILSLLSQLRDERGITILYITHDLATAAYFTDRIAVMYLGRVMEIGPTRAVLGDPRHPYTQALLSVVPAPNPRRRHKRTILVGETPNPIDLPAGCRFQPRCPAAMAGCSLSEPTLKEVGVNHQIACLFPSGDGHLGGDRHLQGCAP
ncbi:MAG: ABC transporter ATP-binding protein [Chloroflexota bacterium]